jgi:hypothetical protein
MGCCKILDGQDALPHTQCIATAPSPSPSYCSRPYPLVSNRARHQHATRSSTTLEAVSHKACRAMVMRAATMLRARIDLIDNIRSTSARACEAIVGASREHPHRPTSRHHLMKGHRPATRLNTGFQGIALVRESVRRRSRREPLRLIDRCLDGNDGKQKKFARCVAGVVQSCIRFT